jgi:hypothetical protein
MWLSNWQMYYVAAKLLWNIDLSIDKILANAYDIYYGKAAPAMKKYHALRRKLWENAPGHAWYPGPQMRSGFCMTVPGSEKELNAYLAKAKSMVLDNPRVLQHIAMDQKFLKKYWGNNAKKVCAIMSTDKKMVPLRTSDKIVIDGNLTENSWLQARPVSGFLTLGSKEQPRENTSVRILYDKENLYFGIVASAKNTWGNKQKTKATKRDGKVWGDDSVELQIAPPNKSGDFYHFMVNTKGVVYDAVMNGPGSDTSYDAKAEFKVKRSGDNYVYEIKLPLSAMKTKIVPGQIWRMHVVRNCRSLQAPTTSETSTLDATRPHQVNSFRLAVFGKDLIRNGNFAQIGERKNKDGSKYKFPKYWSPAGSSIRKHKIEKTNSGNILWYNGVIYSYFAVSKNSTGTYKFVVQAKGKGKIDCRTWSWEGYKPRTNHRRLKLGAFKLTDEFKEYTFKCKVLPDEHCIIWYIYGTDISVKNVSCTIEDNKENIN